MTSPNRSSVPWHRKTNNRKENNRKENTSIVSPPRSSLPWLKLGVGATFVVALAGVYFTVLSKLEPLATVADTVKVTHTKASAIETPSPNGDTTTVLSVSSPRNIAQRATDCQGDLNARDDRGFTPLSRAIDRGNTAVAIRI